MIRRRHLLACVPALALGAATARADTPAHLTVVLDWLFNVNHAALFAAEHYGAFARAGLAVTVVSPSDPDSPSRLVAAGQADLAVSYGTQINMLVDRGLPLLRVGTLIDRPVNAVMALGDGIHTIADLKGRRIGVSVGGVEEALLEAMLRHGGLAVSDVTVIKVNYQMVTALLSRRIDAAIGAFRNGEVLQVRATGAVPVVFAPEDHGVPPYDELILVAQRNRAHDPRIAAFLGALREGIAVLQKQPAPSWQDFRMDHPELDTPVVATAWPMTLGWLAHDPALLDAPRYLRFQEFCVQRGIVAKSLPIGSFAA